MHALLLIPLILVGLFIALWVFIWIRDGLLTAVLWFLEPQFAPKIKLPKLREVGEGLGCLVWLVLGGGFGAYLLFSLLGMAVRGELR
ncbi:MAG TPA: hypothetical protein VIV60_20330 [Polyangiaceae bacterium]